MPSSPCGMTGNDMHPYATDSNEKKMVPLYLAIISVLAPLAGFRALTGLHLIVPWWIDAPSVMGCYGLIHTAFDRWIWRWTLLRRAGVVRIPDLNGTWSGHLCSSFDLTSQTPVNVDIHQTWSNIAILLTSQHSQSSSIAASLITQNPAGPWLSYEYDNQPAAHATATMHAHRGTASLRLRADNKQCVLDGEYYTGRDRGNFGSLELTKQL